MLSLGRRIGQRIMIGPVGAPTCVITLTSITYKVDSASACITVGLGEHPMEIGRDLDIGDGICLRLVDLDGYRAQIAIEAPKEILILREEVAERTMEDQRQVAARRRDAEFSSKVRGAQL